MPGIGSVQCLKPPPREKKAPRPLQRRQTPRTSATTKARRKVALARVQAERDAKETVRERDQHCRWPGCPCVYWPESDCTNEKERAVWTAIQCAQEVAHLHSKGMGGDKKLTRTKPELMILLCKWRHQGPISLHTERAKIVPLTSRGTDGPCEFFTRPKDGRWISAGVN